MRDIKELAAESLEFARAINMKPVGWKLGRLEREQADAERLLNVDTIGMWPYRDCMMGLPIEWTDAPSQLDIVLR
jgi:hypothetical protein